eukprot:TRINITY_DN9724_c0_g1_i1.p1 TRINITY_DN9724_c0_g1~~TRINITY_DN9724_c0_g1_i1.p1  ORF type:complete len:303 (+),score=-3.23 TRINITY_DN9724_c0_g1_i1:33-941(+)
MGSGVGKAFDVRVVASVGAAGGVASEVLEFPGRPSLRQLTYEIEARLDERYKVAGWPFRVASLKVLSDDGEWHPLRDTSSLLSGQTVRVVQPGERDGDLEIPLKVKAKIVFKQIDSLNKGYIDAADARAALRGGHFRVAASALHEWFQEADASKTGRVTWRSWAKFAMKYPAVINMLYNRVKHWKHSLDSEANVPRYMVSTKSTRHRSGQSYIDSRLEAAPPPPPPRPPDIFPCPIRCSPPRPYTPPPHVRNPLGRATSPQRHYTSRTVPAPDAFSQDAAWERPFLGRSQSPPPGRLGGYYY